MPNKRPKMKMSAEEEAFLHQWMRDEANYRDGPGPAKKLQIEHHVVPAQLAILIAAAIPDTDDQAAIAADPTPAALPLWPWTEDSLTARLREARSALAEVAA
jgi:hypothetical protein